MSIDPGAVLIQGQVRAGKLSSVVVTARRPQLASHLRGQSEAAVLRRLPLLYAVCTRAQSAAAAAAFVAARGASVSPEIDPHAGKEAAREHLLAVLTGATRPFLAQAVRRLENRVELRSLLREQLLGMPLESWLGFTSGDELREWAESSGAALAAECRQRLAWSEPLAGGDERAGPTPRRTSHLPVLDAAATVTHWPGLSPDFAAAPVWNGRPAEVGAICRQTDHPLVRSLHTRPLLQRWIARLVELARYVCSQEGSLLGRVSGSTVAGGIGRSAVETARGILMHEVAIANGRVHNYVVVAPTEWNFHADGPARQWLDGIPVESQAAALTFAQHVAQALDPCVECHYQID